MEERLKEEVELKLGQKIISRGNCQLLSDLIYEQQKKHISYNTLRRFFKVDKGAQHKASQQTLNTLSKYIGFPNYFAFTSGEPSKVSWELHNELFYCLDEKANSKLLNFLISCRIQKSPQLMELLAVSFRELFLAKKYAEIHQVCKSKGLNLIGLSYSERVQFGHSVGLLLRNLVIPKKELIALAENTVFLEMVFLIFVDYSSLNSNETTYVKLITLIENGEVRLKRKDALFFQCLGFLRNFLLEIPNVPFRHKPQGSLHPILYSRVCSVLLIQNVRLNKSNQYIINDLTKKLKGPLENRMDYIFEVITTALLLKDFELMEFIAGSDTYAEGKLYQESHLQQVLIVKMIYFLKKGWVKKAQKNLIHVNKKGWGRSYFDIYELFLLILTFELETDASIKKRILTNYLQQVKKLNYSLFNKAFLLNYFK